MSDVVIVWPLTIASGDGIRGCCGGTGWLTGSGVGDGCTAGLGGTERLVGRFLGVCATTPTAISAPKQNTEIRLTNFMKDRSSSITNNASSPGLDRRARREQIFVTTVKNEGQALMRDTQRSRGARNAATTGIESLFD